MPRLAERYSMPRVPQRYLLQVGFPAVRELADAVLRVSDGTNDLGGIGRDAATAELRSDHAADERVQLLHLIAGDLGLGVGCADARVIREEEIAAEGRLRADAHHVLGLRVD